MWCVFVVCMVSHADIDTVLQMLLESQGTNTMLGRLSRKYDPFKVLISTILSARAKDEVTEVVAERLFEKYPSVDALARAKQKNVIDVVRKIGFFNAKSRNVIAAAQMLLDRFGGRVPESLEELIQLPGVGRKVANCVLVYAFKQDAIPVDIHVHRISNRLGWVSTKSPEQTEQELMRLVPKKHWQVINDTFVSHGKTVCVPVSPFCSKCSVFKYCGRVNVVKRR